MGKSLIAFICIHDISAPSLSETLTAAYNQSDESPASLVLLTEDSRSALQHYTQDSFSRPPIGPFESPFLGKSIQDVAGFLNDNAHGTIVEPSLFFVADEQTAKDNTLLLVQGALKSGTPDNTIQTVRLAAEFANTEALAISVATKGINELQTLQDGDGVYRGGPRHGEPPKKGGKAPRKQL
ncbi:MAG: hypothetical protein M1819_004660 [Sarea resinae]|nr:MAG: hypothetical protein M1819_004660 [Sarea resinae]